MIERPEYRSDWPPVGRDILPKLDDAPHDSSGQEWWYLNAHLCDEAGAEYSMFAAFFRFAAADPLTGGRLRHAHMLAWGLLEVESGRYRTAVAADSSAVEFRRRDLTADRLAEPNVRQALLERLSRGVPAAPDRLMNFAHVDPDRLDLRFGDASLANDGDDYLLTLADGDIGCGVRFRPGCDPVRLGIDGIVPGRVGRPQEAMFYYSIPRGRVTGAVTVDGQARTIASGTGWFDHEFGGEIRRLDTAPDPGEARTEIAWQWGGLHLNDGSELSFQLVLTVDVATGATNPRHRAVIIVSSDGSTRTATDLDLEVLQEWTSLRTFSTYPVQMRVRSTHLEVDLTVTAARFQQECVTMTVAEFWEGRVTATGTVGDAPITGLGFVEVLPARSFDTLETFLARPGGRVRRHVAELYPDPVERRHLTAIAGGDQALLHGVEPKAIERALVRPTRHLVDNGGKTWRPFLFTVAMHACGADAEPVAPLMSVAELLHVGAMMVDDVEDGSPVRRGVPATHVVYGEPLTINAGNALFFSFDRIARTLPDQDAAVQLELYRSFCETVRLAHTGQALDLLGLADAMQDAIDRGDPGPVEERVLAIHRLKTGAPVRGLADAAAVLARATPTLRGALRGYFGDIGLAYQISDDVWDLTGDQFRPGRRSARPRTRPLGEDIRSGKVTLPLVKAVGLLPRSRMQRLWDTISARPTDPHDVAHCIHTLVECGATRTCIDHAASLVEASWRMVQPMIAGNSGEIAARAVGLYCVHRDNPR